MNYIKIFQNSQDLLVAVRRSYSENQLMHIFLDNFYQGGKYSAQIDIHQADLRKSKKLLIKNIYLFYPYRLTI